MIFLHSNAFKNRFYPTLTLCMQPNSSSDSVALINVTRDERMHSVSIGWRTSTGRRK